MTRVLYVTYKGEAARSPREDGRDWSDAFIMQGIPRIAGDNQKAEEDHEMEFSLRFTDSPGKLIHVHFPRYI